MLTTSDKWKPYIGVLFTTAVQQSCVTQTKCRLKCHSVNVILKTIHQQLVGNKLTTNLSDNIVLDKCGVKLTQQCNTENIAFYGCIKNYPNSKSSAFSIMISKANPVKMKINSDKNSKDFSLWSIYKQISIRGTVLCLAFDFLLED